jgi:hypothetical protein
VISGAGICNPTATTFLLLVFCRPKLEFLGGSRPIWAGAAAHRVPADRCGGHADHRPAAGHCVRYAGGLCSLHVFSACPLSQACQLACQCLCQSCASMWCIYPSQSIVFPCVIKTRFCLSARHYLLPPASSCACTLRPTHLLYLPRCPESEGGRPEARPLRGPGV